VLWAKWDLGAEHEVEAVVVSGERSGWVVQDTHIRSPPSCWVPSCDVAMISKINFAA
jgi:hypothetical protein